MELLRHLEKPPRQPSAGGCDDAHYRLDGHGRSREKLKNLTLEGVAEKIRMPTFISHGEDDRQNTVENAYKMYEALTGEKAMNIVPKETTGSAHCHIDNFTKADPLFDWLEKKMGTMPDTVGKQALHATA